MNRIPRNAILLLSILLLNYDSIAQTINYQTIKYDNINFSKSIDITKPVGAIQGAASVDLMGGAGYSIPIKAPVGSHNIVPQISVNYNSNNGNGIAGWVWQIGGLSAISRTPKNNFLDGNAAPIELTYDDPYSIDGMRLYPENMSLNGTDNAIYH
jgi:hypothetical protein